MKAMTASSACPAFQSSFIAYRAYPRFRYEISFNAIILTTSHRRIIAVRAIPQPLRTQGMGASNHDIPLRHHTHSMPHYLIQPWVLLSNLAGAFSPPPIFPLFPRNSVLNSRGEKSRISCVKHRSFFIFRWNPWARSHRYATIAVNRCATATRTSYLSFIFFKYFYYSYWISTTSAGSRIHKPIPPISRVPLIVESVGGEHEKLIRYCRADALSRAIRYIRDREPILKRGETSIVYTKRSNVAKGKPGAALAPNSYNTITKPIRNILP